MTLTECTQALTALLDAETRYDGNTAVFTLGSHADAIRTVRRARDALVTMRQVDAGISEQEAEALGMSPAAA